MKESLALDWILTGFLSLVTFLVVVVGLLTKRVDSLEARMSQAETQIIVNFDFIQRLHSLIEGILLP